MPSFIRSIPAAVAGLLYPPLCPVCLATLPPRGEAFCPACRAAMTPAGAGHPLVAGAARRFAAAGGPDGFTALYLFEERGPLRPALHLLKYSGMHSLGTWFGRRLGAAVRDDPALSLAEVLVPVPLHPARLRERGYNQAERICAGLGSVTGMPTAARAVVRSRNTPTQTSLGLREREANVRGAFRVPARERRSVAGKTVLLVDDVTTTGATLAACTAALRGAGAGPVFAAAVAVAERAG